MTKANELNRFIYGLLIIVLVGLMIERKFAQEYTSFLEYNMNLDSSVRVMKKGMTQEEVLRGLANPPDEIYSNYDEDGHTAYAWIIKKHQGTLHDLFRIKIWDEKSFTELKLEFDKDKKLVEIYYGG